MAKRISIKRARYQRRKKSVRRRIFGTPDRPRFTVFRTARHIYAQIINDFEGRTLVASSTMEKEIRGQIGQGGNMDAAKVVGAHVAEKAKAAGITEVVFDRNGFKYQGRLQALADAAREKGLTF